MGEWRGKVQIFSKQLIIHYVTFFSLSHTCDVSSLWNQVSSEKAQVKKKVLREVLNCERELLCWMWGGRLLWGAWTENDQWPKLLVSILHRKEFFPSELERRVRERDRMTERQDNRYVGIKQTMSKVAILKSILSLPGSLWSFLRSGVTCSCLLLRKTTLAAWFWIFWRRTFDQKWYQWTKSQTTENEGTHQLNSGFPRQEMVNRANSSDLKILWMTNVVNRFCHRQVSVNVDPDTLDMAFERNITTANSQAAILWSTDHEIQPQELQFYHCLASIYESERELHNES